MYVKNTSDMVTVTVRTRKGFVQLQPLETKCIDPKDLLTALHPFLKEVSQIEEIIPEIEDETTEPKDTNSENVPQIEETTEEETTEKTTPNEEEEEMKDTLIEETSTNSFKVETITTDETITNLEKHLEDLKVTWSKTRKVKQKETLAKEIKELTEKINKLKG